VDVDSDLSIEYFSDEPIGFKTAQRKKAARAAASAKATLSTKNPARKKRSNPTNAVP
jgi:hypothetical protein